MNLLIAFREVFKHLVPLPIRGDKMVSWIGALMAPIQSLNYDFVSWGTDLRYELKFNGQVFSLENRLNDEFDNALRRIYIDDPSGQQIFTAYVFNEIEKQPPLSLYNKADNIAVLGNVIIRNKPELIVTDDFVVHVPVAILNAANQIQMRAVIDKYRIAGKRYTFNPIP